MNNQQQWNELFILYNEELSSTYERAMDMITDESQIQNPHFHEQMRNQVLNSVQAWYKKSFDILGNKTPEQMIDEIETVDDVMNKVKLAAVLCDDDIPEYLKIKIGSFGQQAIPAIMELALIPSWEAGENQEDSPGADILGACIALKILGEWQTINTIESVLEKFINNVMPHELIADAFKMYILGIGDESIPYILESLNTESLKNQGLKGPYEYLLIALTLVSQETKTDDVFGCIRNCFRTMDHRVIGAICIGDYGDPRGISALKGYLDRYQGKFDRQEFYEILSSIKRLGGDIRDIKDPFRDFS